MTPRERNSYSGLIAVACLAILLVGLFGADVVRSVGW